jgi:hypothetical protein
MKHGNFHPPIYNALMTMPQPLFDRTLYRSRRKRSAATFAAHDILHQAAQERILHILALNAVSLQIWQNRAYPVPLQGW